MSHATRLGLDNVTYPASPANLLPVLPPSPDPVLVPSPPGFPLNGAREIEVDLQVNVASGVVPKAYVYYYLFDGSEVCDGLNRGPLVPGAPMRFTLSDAPTGVVAEYIQIKISEFAAPVTFDFVRIAGR